MDLVGAAVPCLIIVAAAFRAVTIVAAGAALESRAFFEKWLRAGSRAREIRAAPLTLKDEVLPLPDRACDARSGSAYNSGAFARDLRRDGFP